MNLKAVKPVFIVLRSNGHELVSDFSSFSEAVANDYANENGGWVIESMIFEKETV
jgi:hypothetical protein